MNFWGGDRQRHRDGAEVAQAADAYQKPSMSDGRLEVMAIYGMVHVGMSRLPHLPRFRQHRLAQVCFGVFVFFTE